MTSKFKCPVCQNNLHKINVVVSTCTNDKCKLWGSSIPNLVLESLTQAKQDLEIARKTLEEIDTTRCIPQQTLISLGKFSKTTRFNAGNIICVATPDHIHNTLEQIKHDNSEKANGQTEPFC